MKYSHLLRVGAQANLSPEDLGKFMGVSGMTLRRWKKNPLKGDLPPIYKAALNQAVNQLVAEKRLPSNSKLVHEIFEDKSRLLPFQNVLQDLNISTLEEANEEGLIAALSQLGNNEKNRREVRQSRKKILSFKKLGREWESKITNLIRVVRSKKISRIDKFIAYGAFIYLITTFDLIPDTLPFFGLLDDMAIAGIVVAYYSRTFPEIFDSQNTQAIP